MLYPMIEDYKDSFRNPDSYFDALKPLFTVPAPWDSSQPHFTTGGFAVVFKLKDAQGKSWAFKCFTQDVDDRKERLQAIATHLQTLKSPYFLDFKYMEKELWVCSKSAGDKEYPVVVMQWIEGKTLGKYIKEICEQNDQEKLYDLLQNCVKMFAYLLDSGMAHGDLKHDNIMVKTNGGVVLIDYDGMFVNTLWYKKMVELGSPSYQHPNRQNNGFNAQLDHFSILIILTSLYTLYLKPSLKTNNDKSDNLLFQQSDFLNPAQSPNFQALASLQNPLLDALTTEIKKVLTQPLFFHIPKLRDFLGEAEKLEKPNPINMVWWEKPGNQLQFAFYAHVRLWKEKRILVTNEFREEKEKEINYNWNIFEIYEKYFEEELKNIPINANIEYILAYLTEISVLDLRYCKITDISPLQHLTNLTTLNLWNNQITDISALKNLTQLTELYLNGNEITDISALKDLTQLTNLNLWGNQITDISPLQHLTNLKVLEQTWNQITDISPLQHLTQLTSLRLNDNKITDISALKNLTQLTDLYLGNNQITDISDLKDSTQLTNLGLSYNQITDISALKNLTQLTTLRLGSNQITDISALKALTKLTELDLRSNGITDISALKALTKLTDLYLRNNQITDISALKALTQLTYLNLWGNQITDIPNLQHLKNLTFLSLHRNPITDISPLQHLKNLTELHLSENKITDISPLQHLTNLTTLYLWNNQITDISPLQHLTNLTTLDLRGNQIPKELRDMLKKALPKCHIYF